METTKCPYCGSKYTIDKGVEESVSKSEHNYFCQACNRCFHVDTDKNTAQGAWLMTFYESEKYSPDFLEVYLTDKKRININQKHNLEYFSGEKMYPCQSATFLRYLMRTVAIF